MAPVTFCAAIPPQPPLQGAKSRLRRNDLDHVGQGFWNSSRWRRKGGAFFESVEDDQVPLTLKAVQSKGCELVTRPGYFFRVALPAGGQNFWEFCIYLFT